MIKTFTQTDLIRYLYQETTEAERTEIDKALNRDSELMDLYKEMCALLQNLNHAQLQPSSATVLNILSHSRNTQPKR